MSKNLKIKYNIPPSKFLVLILALSLIVSIPYGAIRFFYHADSQTDISRSLTEDKERQSKLETQKNILIAKIALENTDLGFTSTLDNYKTNKSPYSKWQVSWQTNFGYLNFELNTEDSPINTENFIRLNYRNSYKNSIIHRIVKQDNTKVIQGGDFDKLDGTGGQSAYYISEQLDNLIPDENWKSKPDINLDTGETKGGVVPNPEYYKNFNNQTGEIEYPKGILLMAKKKYPDSASSQFFITLDKTILPAQYTVIGKVNLVSMTTIDKIKSEVNIGEGGKSVSDGFPNKEIKILDSEVQKV